MQQLCASLRVVTKVSSHPQLPTYTSISRRCRQGQLVSACLTQWNCKDSESKVGFEGCILQESGRVLTLSGCNTKSQERSNRGGSPDPSTKLCGPPGLCRCVGGLHWIVPYRPGFAPFPLLTEHSADQYHSTGHRCPVVLCQSSWDHCRQRQQHKYYRGPFALKDVEFKHSGQLSAIVQGAKSIRPSRKTESAPRDPERR